MAAGSDNHHVLLECDPRAGYEAFCQRNVHKPRLIPLLLPLPLFLPLLLPFCLSFRAQRETCFSRAKRAPVLPREARYHFQVEQEA